jgi:hypothetical protein
VRHETENFQVIVVERFLKPDRINLQQKDDHPLSDGACGGFSDFGGWAEIAMQAPQAQQQQNPATPAASPDTTSQSYGGMPSTNTQGGRRAAEKCRTDPQCNIFFGGS